MNYAPHILQKKTRVETIFDEDGNPIISGGDWVVIGECRCDDNGQMKQIGINGQVFIFSYHVVYEGDNLTPGTEVRCLDGKEVRGEGTVLKSTKCNRLNYAELWM